jgi:hypothetical protein
MLHKMALKWTRDELESIAFSDGNLIALAEKEDVQGSGDGMALLHVASTVH